METNWIDIDLNIDQKYDKVEIIGRLYHSDDYGSRSEDMIEIYLPSGAGIWAGWYPDGMFDRPEGEYIIDLVFAPKEYEFKRLRRKKTRNILEVKSLIETWIVRYYETVY